MLNPTAVLNLALVFDNPIRAALEACSQEMAKLLPSPYVLGVNSLPHVTVLQFLSARPPEEIWLRVRHLVPAPIDCLGIYFEKGLESGAIWHGIRVQLNDTLLRLQKEMIDIIKPDQIINGTGSRFFPHATLGRAEPAARLPEIPLADVAMAQNVPCRLALGRSGENLQFAEILFEQK